MSEIAEWILFGEGSDVPEYFDNYHYNYNDLQLLVLDRKSCSLTNFFMNTNY